MDTYKAKEVLEYTREFNNIKNSASAVAIDIAISALNTVEKIPSVIQNLKNMQSAWEDESFKDRRLAEAHIKSLRTAIEQVEQLLN